MEFAPILGIIGGLLAAWALLLVTLWIFRPRRVAMSEALRIVPDLLKLGALCWATDPHLSVCAWRYWACSPGSSIQST